MEHIQRPHPLGVALGEVVVDRHHVHAAARQRAQEHRQRGHEGLALAGSHFGNFALEEDYTADKLYFVVGHVPLDFVAAGHPAVFPNGVLAVDADELAALACELAVELGSLYGDCVVFGEAAGCFTHHGKYHREMVLELLVEDFEDFLFVLVYLVPKGLTLVEGQCFDLFAEFFDSLGVVRYRLRNLCANGVDFGAQLVERQSFHAGYFGFDSLQHRLYGFHVAERLVAKYLFKNGSK